MDRAHLVGFARVNTLKYILCWRAHLANTTRVQNGVFVGYKQNDDGLWLCLDADCGFTSPFKQGVAIHYGKMHGKAKRDKAFHGEFRCHLCPKVCKSRQGLSSHITRMHRN